MPSPLAYSPWYLILGTLWCPPYLLSLQPTLHPRVPSSIPLCSFPPLGFWASSTVFRGGVKRSWIPNLYGMLDPLQLHQQPALVEEEEYAGYTEKPSGFSCTSQPWS